MEPSGSKVDARSASVAVSRARTHATIYTDDRLGLVDAIDETFAKAKGAAIAIPAPVRTMGMAIG